MERVKEETEDIKIEEVFSLKTEEEPEERTVELPDDWTHHIPPVQLGWIRDTLFKTNPQTGKAELVSELNLWWRPPHPPPSSPDAYFCRPLFLWMPLTIWRLPLVCVDPDCRERRLTAAGLHRTVRNVLDVDGWYDLATECLKCRRCGKKYPAWSQDVLRQMDLGHRSQFPALLTYRYSCDQRVVRMLRERTVVRLHRKLMEQHSEALTRRVLQYLTVCEPGSSSTAVVPPLLPTLPKPKWLLAMYARDVLGRLLEVKANITSVFGRVLKMDSTKKIAKKLAGGASETTAWCTNVGNEHGQVLVSVLTAAEACGLEPMAVGLMKRYREAGLAPPSVMYVDRGCCSWYGGAQVKLMFSEWEELEVRLDAGHFMRGFAAGVTSETHPLYRVFMERLSTCIFQWDPDDVAALRRAKEGELAASGHIPNKVLSVRISRKELALHCRRRTRGVEETSRLIGSLIDLFGRADTLGVRTPLLDLERIRHVWNQQRKHIKCIQDPENVPLYVKTGSLRKGGAELCCYRCARGSASLESFHRHLHRFIPGTSASDAHFQAYFLEGLMRWNDGRMENSVTEANSIGSYGSVMRGTINQLSRKIFGKPWDERHHPPGAYTGELLGIEYLYIQTRKLLSPVLQNLEEEDRLVELVDDEDLEEEECEEDLAEDLTVPLLSEDDHDPTTRTQFPSPQRKPRVGASSVMSQPSDAVRDLSDKPQLPLSREKHPKRLFSQERPALHPGPGRQLAAATRMCPIAPAPKASEVIRPLSGAGSLLGTLVLNPNMTVSMVIQTSSALSSGANPAPAAPVSRYTQRNRRRRAQEHESGVYKRKYVRGVTFNTCSKCGQPKTKEFGHSRYGNATFCLQDSNGKSLNDWLAEQRHQKKRKTLPQ